MREFFLGWRRKAGCVTLVMACMFMVAWNRSITMTDFIFIPVGKDSGVVFSSMCGTVGHVTPDSPRSIDEINWHSQVTSDLERMHFKYSRDLTIPYWTIVLPLTMLSAFLLVRKPRPTTAMTASNAKSAEAP